MTTMETINHNGHLVPLLGGLDPAVVEAAPRLTFRPLPPAPPAPDRVPEPTDAPERVEAETRQPPAAAVPPAPAVPAPMRRPEPVVQQPARVDRPVETVMRPVAAQQVEKGPGKYGYYPLQKLQHVAYAMSVGVGLVGQILFLGAAFGGDMVGYGGAALIAGFAEMTMMAAGDKSLSLRRMRASWVPVLIVGVVVALYSSLLNVTHFMSTNPSMAVMFGGAAMTGFTMHVVTGHMELTRVLADEDARKAAEAKLVEREQAEARRAARSTQGGETPSGKPPKPGRPQPTKAEIVEWSQANGNPGPAKVRAHFIAKYGPNVELKSDRTLRAWCNGTDETN